jgi:hypothetical protein
MDIDSLHIQDSSAFIIQSDSGIIIEDSLPLRDDTTMTAFGLFFGDSTKYNPVPVKTIKSDQKSLFKSQNTERSDLKILERNYLNIDWITIHLIICLILTAWVQIYYSKRLRQIIKAFGAMRYTNILSKEGNLFRERISIPLFIIYLVSLSLLIYQVTAGQSGIEMSGFKGLKFFSIIILVILILWFIKNTAVRFVGKTFKNHIILSEYMHTNFIFNMVTGLILLPFIIVSVYLPSLIAVYTGIALWLAIFLYRFVRELFTGLTYTKFSLFPRILYLCTFEIIPFLVFTKLIMSYLS